MWRNRAGYWGGFWSVVLIIALVAIAPTAWGGGGDGVGPEQVAVPRDVQESMVRTALSNLTAQVWAMVGLMLLGIGAGIIVVGITRRALPNIDGDGPKAWEARHRFLFLLGAAVSAFITFWVEWAYLYVLVNLAWILAVPASLLAALFAAGLNQPLFKPVKAIWRAALARLRKKIEDGGGDASDLDDTNYNKPK